MRQRCGVAPVRQRGFIIGAKMGAIDSAHLERFYQLTLSPEIEPGKQRDGICASSQHDPNVAGG